MRAQNERPALEVRSAEPVGEPPTCRARTPSTHVDPERMRPMSRASQLAALVVGSRDGERILDACAAPGGKSKMLARRGDRRRDPSRARAGDGRGDCRPNVRVVSRPTSASSTRAASTARSSTRRAPGSACSPAAPTCAGARGRCRSCSSSCCRRRPSGREARRDDRLLGLHAERGRERGGRRRVGPRGRAARRSSGRSTRTRRVRSSC